MRLTFSSPCLECDALNFLRRCGIKKDLSHEETKTPSWKCPSHIPDASVLRAKRTRMPSAEAIGFSGQVPFVASWLRYFVCTILLLSIVTKGVRARGIPCHGVLFLAHAGEPFVHFGAATF